MQIEELYKIAFEEYRFQVELNWKRTTFFVTTDLVLFSATAGLLDFSKVTALIAIALYGVGALVAFIGFTTLLKGHQYYRGIAFKKAALEQDLGIGASAVATTQGQQEARTFQGDAAKWKARPLRFGTITWWLCLLFILLILVNFLGVGQVVTWGLRGDIPWY